MNLLHRWLLGISACALLVSFAEQITPVGAVQKIVKFTGGLLLILCILQPISNTDLNELSIDLTAYEEAVAVLETELSENRERELSDSIAERTQAYIEDKAFALGLQVHAAIGTECIDGVPFPKDVVLYGKENEELSDFIAQELGIAKENQTWKEPD